MDPEITDQDSQAVAASEPEVPRPVDPAEPLPGLVAPVPETPMKSVDRPVTDISATPIGQMIATPVVVPPRRQRLVALRTMLRSPKSRLGLGIVLFFVLTAALAPIIAPGDPSEYVGAPIQPPSAQHWLGTDPQGRDVFRLTVWGGQGSLATGIGTGLLATTIAVLIGTVAGYFRGRVDDFLTLLMNLFLVLPGLPILIFLSAYLHPGTGTVIIALALTGWAFGARILRAQALSVREKEFVNGAIVTGESDHYIIFTEILPNLINIVVGNLVGSVTYGINASTGLAFLGLTSVTDVNWGTNLFWAQNGGALSTGAWWTFIPSGLCVAFVAFGLSLINYGMDEITNPRLRAERELKNVAKNVRPGGVRATPVIKRNRAARSSGRLADDRG